MRASAASVDAALSGVEMFAALDSEVRARVAAASRLRTFRRGQFIFGQDDPGDSLLVVAEGRAKVVVRTADGGELLLTVVTAGDTVGELSIVDGGTRSADAETLEDTTVVFVPREVLLQLLRTEPSVAEHILRIMAATLRRLTEATADLVFLDLPRRVAKVLLEHPRTAHGTVDLGLTQSDLAHRVGATRQSVNASLRTLERRGWITVDGQTIVINQVEALSRYAVR